MSTPHLLSPDLDRLTQLQEAWANFLLQGSPVPDTLRDISPELLEAVRDASDSAIEPGSVAGVSSCFRAAFAFAVLRDSRHLSTGHRHSMVRGINTRTRHIGILAGSSLAAGTGNPE